ncbi:MAG: hypothetical protein U0132_01800 [Gemmatimonadaceae bacterium]
MNFGSTPETYGLLIILGFAAVLLVSMAWFVTRVGLRMVGVTSDGVQLTVFAVLAASALLLASLMVDRLGTVTRAVITTRLETVFVNGRGSWRHGYTVAIRTDGSPPQLASLHPSAAVIDQLVEGDTMMVRMLRAGPLSVVRDARETTATLVPWPTVAAVAASLAVLAVAWRWLSSLVVVLGIVAALVTPLWQAHRDQRATDDSQRFTKGAKGTVRQVQRVTRWDLTSQTGTNSRHRLFDDFVLRVPYDVVTVEFTPEGAHGRVLGVDALDAATGRPAPVKIGAPLLVRYDPKNVRDVRIPEGSRRWPWADMVGVYTDVWMVLAALVALCATWAWFWNRLRRRRRLGA